MASDFRTHIDERKKIDDGPPARYQLQLKRVNLDKKTNEESKLRRFILGESDPMRLNRTILLVGATGAGKSTLINALVNFVMGVEFEDKVWFEVISDEKDKPQTETQTSAVSVYDIFGFEGRKVPYSLTIIDTPGFGDTRGLEHDLMVINKLKDLFYITEGVGTVNAVCLVMKATENRLDERTAYIFNSVTSLLGKDMEQNIVVMMTHSSGKKPKNALKALEDAKILCARDSTNEPLYFQFDNCQNETTEDDRDGEEEAERAFTTSNKGMEKFTKFLETAKAQSLKMTVEVIKERIRLTACIQNLEERVKEAEMKQEAIEKNKEELEKFKNEMKENQNFKFNKPVIYKDKVTNGWFKYTVTCNKCEENCHDPCDCTCTWFGPSRCKVMEDGRCTICSGKCPVEDHVRENWKYVTKTRTVETTSEEMKAKYEKNKAKSEKKTTLLEDLEKEMSELKEKKNEWLNEAFCIIVKLEQIALNEDSVSTYIHLEFLIEKIKETGDTEKVQKLEERVKEAEMKQEAIEKNKEELEKFKHEMKENQSFQFNKPVIYKKKETINGKAVTCNKCEENCHDPCDCTCICRCKVMKDKRCTICSGKCPVEDHVRKNWRYVPNTSGND